MLAQLSKYSAASAHLRSLALEKRAGIIGSAAKSLWGAAKTTAAPVGQAFKNWAGKQTGALGLLARNPGKTAVGALTTATGVPAAAGKTQQYKAGFNPQVQQAVMGQPPVPPG